MDITYLTLNYPLPALLLWRRYLFMGSPLLCAAWYRLLCAMQTGNQGRPRILYTILLLVSSSNSSRRVKRPRPCDHVEVCLAGVLVTSRLRLSWLV